MGSSLPQSRGIVQRSAMAMGIAIASMVVLIALIVHLLLFPQLDRLEAELAHRDHAALEALLSWNLQGLETFVREYAWWDESYTWIKKPTAGFFEPFMEGKALSEQNVAAFLVRNEQGGVVYQNGDQHALAALIGQSALESEGWQGRRMVPGPGGIYLCASVGISDNAGQQPVQGWISAARFLSFAEVSQIAQAAGLDLLVHDPAFSGLDSELIARLMSKSSRTEPMLVVDHQGQRRFWHGLQGSEGAPMALVSVLPSPSLRIANLGQIQVLGGAFAATCLLLLVLAGLWLRRQVMDPLLALARASSFITPETELSLRLPLTGAREFQALAEGFNRLLDRLVCNKQSLAELVDQRSRELAGAHRELLLMAEAYRHSLEAMMIVDLEGAIVSVNPAFCRLTGYSEADVLGQNPRVLKSGRAGSEFYRAMWDELLAQGAWSGELWDQCKDGRILPVWMSLSTIRDESGRALYYMAVMRDVSLAKEHEKAMHLQAFYDGLTNLPNRLLLRDRLEKAIESNRRKGLKVAILFLDLDNFKNINDSLGHQVGDALLQAVARRLKELVRPSDTVSRLGGDEFVLVLEDLPDEQGAIHLAGRILHALSIPVEAATHQLAVSTSIGICISPGDGENFDVLLRNADTAMYRAKEAGKHNFALFLPEMNARALQRIQLEQELPRAIQNGELNVWYQPKVEAMSGRIVGVEALVRWRRDGTWVQPVDFVPMAEDLGLVGAMDMEVLAQAARDHARVKEETGLDLHMAVNCSPRVLHIEGFAESVVHCLDVAGMDPRHLELEITETCLVKEFAAVVRVINRLNSLGIGFALDDFGTGYSSLVQLNRLPIQTLKIDRSFVIDLMNFQTANIVSTILTLARNLGLKVVAEGVEEEYQREFLARQGCDLLQGYLISRPLPLAGLVEFIRAGQPAALLNSA